MATRAALERALPLGVHRVRMQLNGAMDASPDTVVESIAAGVASAATVERVGAWTECRARYDGSADETACRAVWHALETAARSEKSAEVLSPMIRALGALGVGAAAEVVRTHAGSPDAGVRLAVAANLPFLCDGEPSAAIADTLIALSRDSDDAVRNWATFGLGAQTDLDTAEVRAALAARLDDHHRDTRDEALVGLACRNDPRAVPIVRRELECGDVGRLAVHAAELLGDPSLSRPLAGLASWWDVDPGLLDRAMRQCDPNRRAESPSSRRRP